MSNDDDACEVNTKGLDQLTKALKNNMARARVGILGTSQTVRNQELADSGKALRDNAASKGAKVNAAKGLTAGNSGVSTNASIGAMHEFGSHNMPQRSFLRVPITEHLNKELEEEGAFSPDEAKQVIGEGSIIPWLKRIAVIAEKIVSDAFDSGGFGKWPSWKNKNYENNTGQILVDTQQLRNSITSDVK